MHILIIHSVSIPIREYGGTERVIWWLGKELKRLGHRVTYLVPPGSSCPFAAVLSLDPARPLNDQIPDFIDVVHLQFQIKEKLKKPYIITHHGNVHSTREFDRNTVFVSLNHAQRNGSTRYVHNGIDPEEYGIVDFQKHRQHLLFLGYAKRPEKNLKDCAYIARKTANKLAVIGGKSKWWRWRPWLDYKGFIGGEAKNQVLQASKALLFPVRWHEPFGLAIVESLYFGSPVIGTSYGSLPELIVNHELGFLSNKRSELVSAVNNLAGYNRHKIHEYVMNHFTATQMTQNYIKLYEKVLHGESLNAKTPIGQENFSVETLLPIFD